MNNKRYKTSMSYRNAGTTMCQLSVVVLLAACGGGQNDSTPRSNTASGSVSMSAAQLAEDGTTTLSLAHAAGAGLIDVNSVETSVDSDIVVSAAVPETGAAIDGESDMNTTNSETDAANSVSTTEQNTDTPANNNSDTTTTVASEQNSDADKDAETDSQEMIPNSGDADADADKDSDADPIDNNADPIDNNNEEPEAPAAANGEDENEQEVDQRTFTSSNTDGFTGEVLADGSVKVTWEADPNARGYNVYRQAQYIKSVFEPEYLHEDTFDESYYYEIQAFEHGDDPKLYYVARGLTVEVSGTGRVNPDAPKPKENILDGYELVFSDEFNGTELDLTKWDTSYIWGDDLVINSELQHYVDIENKPDFGYNPFSFDGESLTITSIKTPDELRSKAFGQDYLSGVITSYDAFKFTYGYVEARVQLPYSQGLWPAFWLLNAYYDKDKPEIDIMEFIGDDQDVVYHTYHYYDAAGDLKSTKSEPSVGVDFTNGWHTFAVEWLPGTAIFYVNGIEQHRTVDSKMSSEQMYIIANTALGGWWPGSPDETTQFPVEYKIDYIRAYQKTGKLQADPTAGKPSELLLWDDLPNVSPSHLPPFELFPQGYPERYVP